MRLIDTFTITGLNPAQLTGASKVTFNAPVYRSDSISGFSQTISGFGVAVNPVPASTTGPLTDTFGNPYYHYEWSMNGYKQNSFVITVTTDFDCAATGSPGPESFSDPYPVSSSGLQQFLQPTDMAQSDNAQIANAMQSAVAGATTEAAAVEQIMDFIKVSVNDNPNSNKDAVSTLTTGTGTCTNRANLALALLRAAGIPARFVNGVVSNNPYNINFVAPEGQGTMQAGWFASEAHTWIEVYFPQKGAWVGYDPYLNFGFVDQRHVKSGVAVDSNVVGKTTGGLGNLLEVVSLNYGVNVQHSLNLGFSQLSDTGSYAFRLLKEQPGGTGIYVLGRDMVNAPTPTPSPTPAPTPVPSVTPTPTPLPNATATPWPNGTITPVPGPVANATATPAPSPIDSTTHQDRDVTGGTDNGTYNISGAVVDALSMARIVGAAITLDGQFVSVDAQGTFSMPAVNGTHTISVSAPGYGSATLSVTVAGADVVQNMRLSHATAGNNGGKSGLPIPGFGIVAAIAGLLIIVLYRYGRS